jgi:hypothetical protein
MQLEKGKLSEGKTRKTVNGHHCFLNSSSLIVNSIHFLAEISEGLSKFLKGHIA